VRDRGRDVEGCIKQWFAFVKPNFENVSMNLVGLVDNALLTPGQYVQPQRVVAGEYLGLCTIDMSAGMGFENAT
jgi:hypothetical protein